VSNPRAADIVDGYAMPQMTRRSTSAFRAVFAGACAILAGACSEEPVMPKVVAGTGPLDSPAMAEAAVPLVELTISGVGTSAPTSSIRVLPATTGSPNSFGPDLRTTAAPPRPVNREILRTPFGRVLDYAPDGGWRTLARKVSAYRHNLLARGNFAALNAPMAAGPAPSPAAITGTKKIPVIMFRFSNVGTGVSNPPADYQAVLFGDQPIYGGRPYSIKTFYSELSNGMVTLDGKVIGWHTLPGNEASYTGGSTCSGNPFGGTQCNGIFSGTAYTALLNGLNQAITASDTTDFGQYDNDGPDGIPNSGDDDGFVDLMIFLHSEQDGACGPSSNGHIWSHKGSMSPRTTSSPRAGGGFIKISSYTIQSGVGGASACNTAEIMAIGTAAHETGHAFGLPDLYDTGNSTEGIGQWGLMGSGNYSSPLSPSRMEAWSLNELGWVTLRQLTTDGTYSFGAAPVSDTAFVIRVQGTNSRKEYYFIENRQGVQSDSALIRRHCQESALDVPGLVFPLNCHGGLAIWHADSTKIQTGLPANNLNSGPVHGLSLVQADNFGDLEHAGGSYLNRGDAGDLWPGYGLNTPKTRYSADSRPRAFTNADSAKFIGFTIDQITQLVSEGAMSFRLTFGRPLTPLAAAGADGSIQLNPVSTAAFTVGTRGAGGYNYISATYQVRNAPLTGAGYPSSRNNLTFLAVATPATLDQSNIVRAWRFDQSPSSLSSSLIEPTGAAMNSGGVAVGSAADVFQAYREPELTSLAPIAGISGYLPYGFVVRNPNHANDRVLPASPGVGVYDGLVTFAYRVPLQPTAADDPYYITAKFLPVDDDQRWVTQSVQETDASSVTAVTNRANALGAGIRSLSAATVGSRAADTVCVRIAGPAGSPTHSIGAGC
jgi:M6 family metalloprotease-like protein